MDKMGYFHQFLPSQIQPLHNDMVVRDNVPGSFLGAEIYEQFILPFEKKYIDFIQEQCCPSIYHNCGQILKQNKPACKK